jgi:hypothetical protein
VAAGTGLAWIVFWSRTSSLSPFRASPAYFTGLVLTALALTLALDLWAGVAGRIASRLIAINVVWYSARESSEFWLIWGLWSFVRPGMRVAGELRVGRSR